MLLDSQPTIVPILLRNGSQKNDLWLMLGFRYILTSETILECWFSNKFSSMGCHKLSMVSWCFRHFCQRLFEWQQQLSAIYWTRVTSPLSSSTGLRWNTPQSFEVNWRLLSNEKWLKVWVFVRELVFSKNTIFHSSTLILFRDDNQCLATIPGMVGKYRMFDCNADLRVICERRGQSPFPSQVQQLCLAAVAVFQFWTC